MNIRIIKEKISLDDWRELARETFGDMVKVVVDLRRGVLAAGGEMHSDCEQFLLSDGSAQENLWGANIYPEEQGESRFEYDSLINIRPRAGNRTTRIEDERIRAQVKAVIDSLISD